MNDLSRGLHSNTCYHCSISKQFELSTAASISLCWEQQIGLCNPFLSKTRRTALSVNSAPKTATQTQHGIIDKQLLYSVYQQFNATAIAIETE